MDLSSIRIVIVDDAPFIREVASNIASHHGMTVVGEAGNGAEAIEVVADKRPDVVLMDMVMPEMTGVEATAEILVDHPNIKIIACSSVDDQSMVMRAMEAGCCDYLLKPFSAEALVKSIKSSVEGGE